MHSANFVENRAERENAVLDAELEIFRKRRELLLLKREVMRAEPEIAHEENAAVIAADVETQRVTAAVVPPLQTAVPIAAPAVVSRGIEFNDIKYAVQTFTGEDPSYDVNDFFARLDNVLELSNANERVRSLAIRQKTEGAAQLLIQSTGVFTYDAMQQALLGEFENQLTPADIERMLRQHKWSRKEETMHYYVLYMEKLAKRMGRNRLTEVQLVDAIIDGMCETFSNAQLLHGSQTVRELKERMKRYEHRFRSAVVPVAVAVQRNSNDARPKTNAVTPAAVAVAARSNNADRTSTADTTRCFNCSKFGHMKTACPYPLRPEDSCFKKEDIHGDHAQIHERCCNCRQLQADKWLLRCRPMP